MDILIFFLRFQNKKKLIMKNFYDFLIEILRVLERKIYKSS